MISESLPSAKSPRLDLARVAVAADDVERIVLGYQSAGGKSRRRAASASISRRSAIS